MKIFVCDQCGYTYKDVASIREALSHADAWAALCRRDGVEPRGIGPCPHCALSPCHGKMVAVSVT